MYAIIRPFLFGMDAEKAHHLTLNLLKTLHYLHLLPERKYHAPASLMGLTLPNPIGLAAGLDKNGDYLDALAALGFGFIEIGTVTPKAQSGNPKPRLFRDATLQVVVNRMGFNNQGIDTLIRNVQKSCYRGILGINIGKNATTALEHAHEDYLYCLEKAYPHASYITVNISSPNTQNLRQLQAKDALSSLLDYLQKKREQLTLASGRTVPLALKIAPDLSVDDIRLIVQVASDAGIDAIIATNTTMNKKAITFHHLANETGGLSGAPLSAPSLDVLQTLIAAKPASSRLQFIGTGGVMRGEDAALKMAKGASAVQLYSGLVFEGPRLIHDCVKACAAVEVNS